MNFSNLKEDLGYVVIRQNIDIDKKFPFKSDVDPRLVRYLRSLYFYKINDLTPCVPLEMEFYINKIDYIKIIRYLRKYNLHI